MTIVGIDLAGSPKRNTGICIMKYNLTVNTKVVHEDEEIFNLIKKERPRLIAIDAPLSIPYDRKSIEDKRGSHLRECDRKMLEMGIKFFPITLGPMRMLTKRGIKLKKIFENMRYKVIEVYPGGAQDILGIPRKNKGLDSLRKGLIKLGIKNIKKTANGDELDAITAAYVGWLYLKGEALIISGRDGSIVMPSKTVK